MGGILAYLILAIPIFTGVYADYTPADLAQLISNYSFQSQYLIYLFTRLYDTLGQISVVAGNCRRVGELIERMNLLGMVNYINKSLSIVDYKKNSFNYIGSNSFGSKPKNDGSSSTRRLHNTVEPISTPTSNTVPSDLAEPYLTINKVTVRVPDSDRVLIENLSFELKKGKLDNKTTRFRLISY